MKRFNLVPKQGRKGQPSPGPGIFKKGFRPNWIIAAAVVLAAVIILPNFVSSRREGNITKIKKQTEEMKQERNRFLSQRLQTAKEYDLLMKRKLAADARLQYLKESKADKPGELSRSLVYLPTLIPDEIWINKLAINRDGVVVNGSTLDNQAVSRFMDNLNRSDRFKGSSFNFTQKNEVGGAVVYNFEIATNLVK